jgi:hypothetical protein
VLNFRIRDFLAADVGFAMPGESFHVATPHNRSICEANVAGVREFTVPRRLPEVRYKRPRI